MYLAGNPPQTETVKGMPAQKNTKKITLRRRVRDLGGSPSTIASRQQSGYIHKTDALR